MLTAGKPRLALVLAAALLLPAALTASAADGKEPPSRPAPASAALAAGEPRALVPYARSPGGADGRFAPFDPADPAAVVVTGPAYAAASDPAAVTVADGALHWSGADGSWVEWTVQAPADGLYRIGLVFDAADDREDGIGIGLQVNGRYPFREAEHVTFKREFVHETFPPKRDGFGNDVRPRSVEAEGWKEQYAADYGADPLPLRWELKKGANAVRLTGRGQPIAIRDVRLLPAAHTEKPETAGDGAAVGAGSDGAGGWYRLYEAEAIRRKSDASIQLQTADNAKATPPTDGLVRYNAIGGEQFRRSGEWVEWEFEVPESGEYEIGFKFMQSYINNVYVYRSVWIDGRMTEPSLGRQRFPYGTAWQTKRLEREDGSPLRVPLAKGKHTLRLTTAAYPVTPIREGIEAGIRQIADLEFAVRKVTGNFEKFSSGGGNADANRDWDLEAYIPDLRTRLTELADRMLELAGQMKTVTSGGTSDVELALRSAARELDGMADRPADIPNEMNRFASMQKNLSQWLYRLTDQSLALDSFWVAEPGAGLPRLLPNGLETAAYAVRSFFRTFTIDYDFRKDDPDAIDVWVNRNRDYASLIGRLAEETFTPATGIAVNVNIVPDPQLFVLGNAAGIRPDVALGVDQAMPVDFASRGALLDLSQFPDYPETAGAFHPGALRAFHYKGGDYALPEVQSFQVLAYRTDILKGLGLSPPDTWEELYRMLPNLQQNGYDFYLNPKDYQTFLYQNGAELYAPDGMSSALDTEEAYAGFRQWTEMFTLYQLPREVPSFFTHFRQGGIPIGVIDFNTYLQLQFAAPEIAGKWAIAPIPGTKRADGTVARWSGGGMQAAVAFGKTEKKAEAWAFLKWWASASTQERFGREVEALFGPEYRWNTANREAFGGLPWPAEHRKTIEEQMRWFKEAPQVPGGYFTARQMDFAWNGVVINRRNIRESLEKAVLDINREMVRKQTEFGLRDRLGGVKERLDVPSVREPPRDGGR
ncbi:extracellular solute-binding protein [Paenibacillus flagellatus]|uniref:ABC transporter substrate-binding protein n=1 Tax=Paenibacillus flagellatus TaxID=2211139 RepID=A0A2V5K9V0_9BACL|nr:extracellular solute-binding protein [Paenibacillus flagellatus]PYI56178.1 hypothetical protein DLM86_04095 [Paenibacillus flagellatus]